jgi:oligopeptide transport system permease protein
MSEKNADKHMPIIENDYDSRRLCICSENECLTDKEYADTSYLKDVWSHFKKNKGAVIGMVIITLIILFAIIGPMISGYSYKEINIQYQDLPPKIQVLAGWDSTAS